MAEYNAEDYARANQLNAHLATRSDPALIQEARQLAADLLAYVKTKVADYPAFEARVRLSEEFSLTESKRVAKTEKDLKQVYLRATTLLETVAEAEARARRR